jgi:hypothetical protein
MKRTLLSGVKATDARSPIAWHMPAAPGALRSQQSGFRLKGAHARLAWGGCDINCEEIIRLLFLFYA